MKWHKFNQHFTPNMVLEDLQDLLSDFNLNPTSVADFAVGEGALLKVAELCWPTASIIGNDIDRRLISKLRSSNPNWTLHSTDFYKTRCLKQYNEKIDLILMNPPFSRGNEKEFVIEHNKRIFKTSYSMVFLLNMARKCTSDGVIVCILPDSIRHSIRDREAWEYINVNYEVSIIKDYKSGVFPKCGASTFLAMIRRRRHPLKVYREIKDNTTEYKISRGWMQLHDLSKYVDSCDDEYLFIHTTSLRNNNVEIDKKVVSARFETGPLLIIPRVGKPDKRKIVLVRDSRKYALSDCIIAIKSDTYKLELLRNHMMLDSEYNKLYRGTGAKYISILHLSDYIQKIATDYNLIDIQHHSVDGLQAISL